MTNRIWCLSLALVLVLGIGCNKKKDDAAGSSGAAAQGSGGGTAEPAAAAAPAFLPVEKIGVQLEMPAGAKADETSPENYMLSAADGSCVVMLSKVNPEMAPSYDFMVKQAEGDSMGNKFKAFSKNEQANGGWALEWTYTSGTNGGDMWGVNYRVVLENGQFDCSRNVRSAEDAACVSRACASLKKL